MTDLPPKPPIPTRKTGLSPKEQKLQAAMEKAANAKTGSKTISPASNASFRAKSSFAGTKESEVRHTWRNLTELPGFLLVEQNGDHRGPDAGLRVDCLERLYPL